MFLLDTNVVSEWVTPRPDANVINWLDQTDEDRVFLSVVTIAEVRAGVDRLEPGQKRDRLDAWLRHDLPDRFARRLLPIDTEIADRCGALIAQRRRSGRPLNVMDGLVAATASVHALAVVTRNAADFAGLGVDVVNPWV